MEYFYSDSPTACNEYKKQNSLDECFALKSVFGTCNDECNSSTWTPDEKSSFLEEEHAISDIFGSKNFFHHGTKKKMVIFKSSAGYCGLFCTHIVGAAILYKKEKELKIDAANKELFGVNNDSRSSFENTISLKFKQLGKDDIAAAVEEVNPMSLYEPLHAYATTTTIIGTVNNELHRLLSIVTAEEYFRPNEVPYKWESNIKGADESDHRYDIAIHSYGINGTGRYFDRTRWYAVSEGKLNEVWRDDEKEVDKQDKDIGAICQAVDEKNDLHDTCALFKKGEIGENFPLKSNLLENVCFDHYKQFHQESMNKICSSYDYDDAIRRYNLLADS